MTFPPTLPRPSLALSHPVCGFGGGDGPFPWPGGLAWCRLLVTATGLGSSWRRREAASCLCRDRVVTICLRHWEVLILKTKRKPTLLQDLLCCPGCSQLV